jgi:hypothetical protein
LLIGPNSWRRRGDSASVSSAASVPAPTRMRGATNVTLAEADRAASGYGRSPAVGRA